MDICMRWTLLLSFALIAVSRSTVQGVQGEVGCRDSRLDSTVFHGWGRAMVCMFLLAVRGWLANKPRSVIWFCPAGAISGAGTNFSKPGVYRPRITTNPRLFRVHSSIAGRRIGDRDGNRVLTTHSRRYLIYIRLSRIRFRPRDKLK